MRLSKICGCIAVAVIWSITKTSHYIMYTLMPLHFACNRILFTILRLFATLDCWDGSPCWKMCNWNALRKILRDKSRHIWRAIPREKKHFKTSIWNSVFLFLTLVWKGLMSLILKTPLMNAQTLYDVIWNFVPIFIISTLCIFHVKMARSEERGKRCLHIISWDRA